MRMMKHRRANVTICQMDALLTKKTTTTFHRSLSKALAFGKCMGEVAINNNHAV